MLTYKGLHTGKYMYVHLQVCGNVMKTSASVTLVALRVNISKLPYIIKRDP